MNELSQISINDREKLSAEVQDSDGTAAPVTKAKTDRGIKDTCASSYAERRSGCRAVSRHSKGERLGETLGVVRFQ